jgi:hypothetical protein
MSNHEFRRLTALLEKVECLLRENGLTLFSKGIEFIPNDADSFDVKTTISYPLGSGSVV